jgi:voltage-gated potassium channel
LHRPGDALAGAVEIFIISLIILNVAAVALGTVSALQTGYHAAFAGFELFTVIIFTIEYVLRLWCITESERFRDTLAGRVRYAFTAWALVDLLAILPVYLLFAGTLDLRILRRLRLVRVMKLGRYWEPARLLWKSLKSKR